MPIRITLFPLPKILGQTLIAFTFYLAGHFSVYASTAVQENTPVLESSAIPDEFERALTNLRRGDDAHFADYLRGHIQGQEQYCGAVTDFQVVDRAAKRLAVKARCLGMPLYGLIFKPGSKAQIFGGDGMVAPLTPSEGAIIQVPLVNAIERQTFPSGNIQNTPGTRQTAPVKTGTSWWLIVSIGLNFMVVGGLLIFAISSLRSKDPWDKVTTENLSTSDKNTLITQSVEVLRCVHLHPSGVYIVKGQHGKRRLFRSIIFAVLYRDYGVKLREIN